MPENLTVIERAIQLAKSGECDSVNHIRQRLKREGFVDVGRELRSPDINRLLIGYMHNAR